MDNLKKRILSVVSILAFLFTCTVFSFPSLSHARDWSGNGYRWPLNGDTFRITTIYRYSSGAVHSSRYYAGGKGKTNTKPFGVDIAAPSGTPVYAVLDGTVQNVQWQPNGFGNVFEIKHDNGVISLYAHLSKVLVSNGQRVRRGQHIGNVGSTGKSSGAHLHFEFSVQNPYDFFKGYGMFKVVAARGDRW